MDGSSCELCAVPNVRGADVCTWVPQSETELCECALGLSHHITGASLSPALHINICLQLLFLNKEDLKPSITQLGQLPLGFCVHIFLWRLVRSFDSIHIVSGTLLLSLRATDTIYCIFSISDIYNSFQCADPNRNKKGFICIETII